MGFATGKDKLYGGLGNDLIYGGHLDDKIHGGEGDDFHLVSHFPLDLLAQIHWCQAFSPKSHIIKQRHTKVEVNEHCHVQYL